MFLLATPILALGSLFFAIASNWTVAIPAMFLTMLACQLASTRTPSWLLASSCITRLLSGINQNERAP
jgi:hypothetical protein